MNCINLKNAFKSGQKNWYMEVVEGFTDKALEGLDVSKVELLTSINAILAYELGIPFSELKDLEASKIEILTSNIARWQYKKGIPFSELKDYDVMKIKFLCEDSRGIHNQYFDIHLNARADLVPVAALIYDKFFNNNLITDDLAIPKDFSRIMTDIGKNPDKNGEIGLTKSDHAFLSCDKKTYPVSVSRSSG